jgi:hypothetical protein
LLKDPFRDADDDDDNDANNKRRNFFFFPPTGLEQQFPKFVNWKLLENSEGASIFFLMCLFHPLELVCFHIAEPLHDVSQTTFLLETKAASAPKTAQLDYGSGKGKQ